MTYHYDLSLTTKFPPLRGETTRNNDSLSVIGIIYSSLEFWSQSWAELWDRGSQFSGSLSLAPDWSYWYQKTTCQGGYGVVREVERLEERRWQKEGWRHLEEVVVGEVEAGETRQEKRGLGDGVETVVGEVEKLKSRQNCQHWGAFSISVHEYNQGWIYNAYSWSRMDPLFWSL